MKNLKNVFTSMI